jgi:hypothetical protein
VHVTVPLCGTESHVSHACVRVARVACVSRSSGGLAGGRRFRPACVFVVGCRTYLIMPSLLGSPLASLRALALAFLLLSSPSDSHATEAHTNVHLQLVALPWSAPKGTILGGLSALADSAGWSAGVIGWKLSYDTDAEARDPALLDAQRCVRPPDPTPHGRTGCIAAHRLLQNHWS